MTAVLLSSRLEFTRNKMASERLCCSLLNISVHSLWGVVGWWVNSFYPCVLNGCSAKRIRNVPICPVTSKRTDWASTTFPMLLIIYFFFSLVESVCKNRYKIAVWNVCHGCGLQVTASPHCGVLVAQLPKYLVYSLHHLPFTAPLTVQWSKNTLHSKLHTGKPQGIHPLCKFSWYRCSCFLLCFVWFLWVRGDKCMGTFLEYFCFALCF